MKRATNISEATRQLRLLLGPTARIVHVERAGVAGVRVQSQEGVWFQTFDLGANLWARCVASCLPSLLRPRGRR